MHPTDINRRFFYASLKHAADYDRTISWVGPLYHVLHDSILRLVAHELKGRRGPFYILDIGCGTGAESISLLDANPNIHLVALDLSEAMLKELGRKLAARRISSSRVTPIEADFLSAKGEPRRLKSYLPRALRRRGFDAVLSAFTFHHFSTAEKRRAYRRSYECLAPGGVLLNGDLFSYDTESKFMTDYALQFDLHWIHKHFTAAAKDEKNREMQIELRRLRDTWKQHYHVDNTCESVGGQVKMLRRIGFKEVASPFRYFQMGLLWARR